MADTGGAAFMCTERYDARALQWLTEETAVSGLRAAGAGQLPFDAESAFARAQGLDGQRFDAGRLWTILKAQLKGWATSHGKVWYRHAAGQEGARGGLRLASTGYAHWPPVITATLARGQYWQVRVDGARATGAERAPANEDVAWTHAAWADVKSGVVAAAEARAATLKTPLPPVSTQKAAVFAMALDTEEQRALDAVVDELNRVHLLHTDAYLPGGVLLVRKPDPAASSGINEAVLQAVSTAVALATGYAVQLRVEEWVAPLAVPAKRAPSGEDAPVRAVCGVKRKKRRDSDAVEDPEGPRGGGGGGADMEDGEGEEDDDMLAPGVSKEEYAEMKAAFEERHFYYVPANTFVEVTEDFALKHYDLRHAKEYFDIGWAFGGERNFRFRVSFLDLWRLDPTRKSIHRIDFKPSDDPAVFYMPLQFAYTRVKLSELLLPAGAGGAAGAGGGAMDDDAALEAHREALWDMFRTLVKAACDDKEDLVEYLLNYFAHMLQKPLEQPGVAIILTGQKGVGKDTLLDFFRLHVIGSGLSHNYTETRQFFDKHDVDRKDKIMVKMEDSDSALCKQHAKDLRARITAREGTINPKGKDPITFPNYVRYFFTANQAIPVGINDDNDRERRFVIVPVSNVLKGNTDFFTRCYDEAAGLYTPMGGHVVAHKLLARDLSGWNVRLQPKNDYQEALYEVERTPEQRFLDDGWPAGAEIKSQELFARYQRFCSDNGFPKWTETAIAFGQKLAYFVMQKKIVKRVGRAKQVFYKKVGSTGEDEDDEADGEEAAGAGAGAGWAGGADAGLSAGMAEFTFSTVTRTC